MKWHEATSPPPRFKPRAEWTVAEVLENRANGTRPESDEYREYVAEVHAAAGLEPPDGEPKDLEDMSVEDHAKRKYGRA